MADKQTLEIAKENGMDVNLSKNIGIIFKKI